MKLVNGIYLPDRDRHFEKMMRPALHHGQEVGTYQLRNLLAMIAETRKRRVALDIGAHCGFFSMWLADEFRKVIAFEPVGEHAECFQRNVRQLNVKLHQCAVGSRDGLIGMSADDENSGKAHVSGRGDIPMVRLDDLALKKVDCIKIDTEGYELEVIKGAAETIKACKPVIMLEQNDDRNAVKLLTRMGMVVRVRCGHDWIMGWGRKE